MNAAALAAHIDTLRQLLAAQKSLDKIRERNSVLRPRTGICGGLATTTAAQWRDKLEAKAEEQSAGLFDVETRREAERLRSEIDCACNALTDSICCSGNDAATNSHFVAKLRRAAVKA